ncbi:MAG: diguanylate cyclase domain-containing protein [Leptospirillia bacterium]
MNANESEADPSSLSPHVSSFFYEESDQNLFILDMEGVLVSANPSFFRETGYLPEAILGKSFRLWCEADSGRLPACGEKIIREDVCKRADGSTLFSEIILSGRLAGERPVVVGFLLDRSQKKKHEEEIFRLATLNRLLATSTAYMAEDHSEDELFSALCAHLEKIGGFPLVWAGRPDREGNFYPLAFSGIWERIRPLRFSLESDRPEGRSLAGQVFLSGTPIFVADLAAHVRDSGVSEWIDAINSSGFRGGSFIPVFRGGHPYAVISLYSFSPESLKVYLEEILVAIVQTLSRALDRIDMRSREREGELLRKILLDHSPSGIGMVQGEKVIYANRVLAETFGYPDSGEMEGLPLRTLWDGPGEERRIEEALSGMSLSRRSFLVLEIHGKRLDGSLLVLDVSLAGVRLDREMTVVLTANDVTERVRQSRKRERILHLRGVLFDLRREIEQAGEEGDLLQSLCNSLVWEGGFDTAGFWSREMDRFLCLSEVRVDRVDGEGEYHVPSLDEKISPDLSEALRGCVAEGIPFFGKAELSSEEAVTEEELRVDSLLPESLSSTRKGTELVLLPVPRGGQAWAVLVLISRGTDTCEPEVREILSGMIESLSLALDRMDLRRSEREIGSIQRAILENSQSGIIMAAGREITYVNPCLIKIFGFDGPENLLGKDSRILYRTREEYERVGALLFPRVLEGKPVFVQDIAGVKKDGTPVWIDLYDVMADVEGRPTIIATLTDVTDRHNQELRLTMVARFRGVLAEVRRIAAVGEEPAMLRSSVSQVEREGGFVLVALLRPDGRGGFYCEEGEGSSESLAKLSPEAFSSLLQSVERSLAWWWPEEASGANISSFFGAVPILRGGGAWAILFLSGNDPAIFSPDVREVLEEIGRSLSYQLDRRDSDARERELSSLTSAIMGNARVGFVLIDLSTRTLLHVNGHHLEELGYGADYPIAGEPARLLLADEEEVRHVNEAMVVAKQEGREWVSLVNVRLRHREGAVILFDLFGHWIEHDGSPRFLWTAVNATERNRLQRRIEHEATHDSLTGLPNRRALDHHLWMAVARGRRSGGTLVVGLLDLDEFKPVNDLHGHEAGDALLREFARRARRLLRESDFLCRLGGDEFVVVLEIFEREPERVWREVCTAMDRLHQAVESPFEVLDGRFAQVWMTMGVALTPEGGETPDALLREADHAMYALKAEKGRRSRWWGRGKDISEVGVVKKNDGEEFSEFGEAAGALLERAAPLVGEATRHFVERFYENLGREPAARRILDRLDLAQMESLKFSQGRHLSFLLSPGTTAEELRKRAWHVGEIHALYGVDLSVLLFAKTLYGKIFTSALGDARLSGLERTRLQMIFEERLGLDIRHQAEAGLRIQTAYSDLLFRPLSLAAPLSVVGQEEVRALAALPGMTGAALVIPGRTGDGSILASPDSFGEIVRKCEDLLEATIESRSLQIGKCRGAEGKETPLSLAALPVSGPGFGRSEEAVRPIPASLLLGGSYPRQFESDWVRHFLHGFAWRWGVLFESAPDQHLSPGEGG